MVANDDHRLSVEMATHLTGMPDFFSTNIDYMAHVLIGWYRHCLLWSGGDSFQAEDATAFPEITTRPPAQLGRMAPGNSRLSDSDIKIHLHPHTLDALLAFREDLGYA